MSYHQSKTSILSSLDKDYIEEGRRDIYRWGETRSTKRKGIRGWAYSFKKMFIDKGVSFLHHFQPHFLVFPSDPELFYFNCDKFFFIQILKSFVNNLTAVLVLQLILSGKINFFFQRAWVKLIFLLEHLIKS